MDSGETWIVVDSLQGLKYQWQSKELNLSQYAGNSQVMLTFKYNDYSYFSGYEAYGWALDNVFIYEPIQRDLNVIEIQNPEYSLAGITNISVQIRNIGADTVFSFDAYFKIHDTLYSSTYSGMPISPFDYFTFTHPVEYNAIPGIDTVFFRISNVNEQGIDGNPGNDSVQKIISFIPENFQRKLLVEDFTSANCTGCAQTNAWLNPLMESNTSHVVQIRYHGLNDEMYLYNTDENDMRIDFYNVPSFPTTYCDGQMLSPSQAIIDSMLDIPALYQIELQATYNDSAINISANTISNADFISGVLSVQIALVENISYSEPPGVNSETYFPYVMRKMFPDANGSAIGKPVIGQQNSFLFNFPFDSVFKCDSLYTIAFVQDKYTKNIYQSSIVKLLPEDTTSIQDIVTNPEIIIYPQPASGLLNINLGVSHKFHKLAIYSIGGRNILNQRIPNASKNLIVDISNIHEGIYLLRMEGDSEFQKLISICPK